MFNAVIISPTKAKTHVYFNEKFREGVVTKLPILYGYITMAGFFSTKTKKGYVSYSSIIETDK